MAICLILENPNQTEEHAEQVFQHLRGTGPMPPEGARLVVTGSANPGWRVISVWDSPDAHDRFFSERLAAAYESAGLSFENVTRTEFEVSRLMAADLTGTPA